MKRERFLRIAITVLFVTAGFYLYAETAESRDKGPAQPILFSHKIHAGDNQIKCETCHSYTEVSPHPGIPSMQKCMGCHSFVAGRDVEYTTQGGQTILEFGFMFLVVGVFFMTRYAETTLEKPRNFKEKSRRQLVTAREKSPLCFLRKPL